VPEKLRPTDTSRISVRVGIDQLSSKQRSAVMGLVKDMGFTREEIKEIVVTLPGNENNLEQTRDL
jgi:hypothetical protein